MLDYEAFRLILRELFLDLSYAGRYYRDAGLFEDRVTETFMNEFMEELGTHTDMTDGKHMMVREELDRLTMENRRLVLCGFFLNKDDLRGCTSRGSVGRFMNWIQWLYESDEPLKLLPTTFTSAYCDLAELATTKAEAKSGDKEAKWFIETREKAGQHAIWWGTTGEYLLMALKEFSSVEHLADGNFRRDLFDSALKSLIKRGDEYAADLKTAMDTFSDDEQYARVGTALMERADMDVLNCGDMRETYMDGLGVVLHHLRLLDANAATFAFWSIY